ncbi:uncharacterized protein (DUF58 family) [Haloferula luteola]|uniref:Uncharacterized protein (DUF58 family) n=1 Tax=Haloferula luteola TaxID=595692 RepID=A0A840VGV4_9BACT|nr:DUF58 domain-containing protein [Haloferula luteola]MBB5353060.1 uncharacterized protein (DUF58 family) [Haloferula luteola]
MPINTIPTPTRASAGGRAEVRPRCVRILPVPDSNTLSPPALRRVLYHFYRSGHAVNFFLRRRVRGRGMALLVMGVILGCLTGGRFYQAPVQLFGFGFILGLISLACLPFRRAKMRIVRHLPDHATAGEKVRITYEVTNLIRRPLHHIHLIETPPNPCPGLQQFAHAREPGGEKRNAFDRIFAYHCWLWLCELRTRFEARESEELLNLRRGQTTTLTTTLLPRKRGLIELSDLRVLLPDALGLYQRCKRTPAPSGTLVVLPARYPLPPFELPGAARFQAGGDAAARQSGPSGEFVSLRDYQPGDPIRLIHWKSWARTGKPVVKELEDTFYPRHGLILDTFPVAGNEALFEAAVSVAASMVSSIDTHECLIELMFISGREHVVTAGRGTGRAETLLEVLASVEASEQPQFESLGRLVLRHAEDLAGCLAVFAGWSDERAEFLAKLESSGVRAAALVLCEGEAPPPRPGVHFLRRDRLAADLMHLPPHL